MPQLPAKKGLSKTLRKYAAFRWPWQEEPESHTGRNIAMGAAAAAPFAGMIGQKAVRDPAVDIAMNVARHTPEEIAAMARPGDVLLGAEKGWSGFKVTQAPFYGPEWSHAESVIRANPADAKAGLRSVAAGDLHKLLAASGGDLEKVRAQTDKIIKAMGGPSSKYTETMLLRPDAPMTPEQLTKFEQEVLTRGTRPYSRPRGLTSTLYDLFVPKLKALEKLRASCTNDMCSTAVSNAMREATGHGPAVGKPSRFVMPADLLREGSGLTPIALHTTRDPLITKNMSRLMRFGTRGAIGAGLAGSVYGLSEDPALAATPLGAMALPALVRKVIDSKALARAGAQGAANQIPRVSEAVAMAGERGVTPVPRLLNIIGEGTPNALLQKHRLLTRTLPLGLLGAGGAYLGAKGIQHLIQKHTKHGEYKTADANMQLAKAFGKFYDLPQSVRLMIKQLAPGALIGGGTGATAGALVDTEHRGRGAAIGGATGAVAGAFGSRHISQNMRRNIEAALQKDYAGKVRGLTGATTTDAKIRTLTEAAGKPLGADFVRRMSPKQIQNTMNKVLQGRIERLNAQQRLRAHALNDLAFPTPARVMEHTKLLGVPGVETPKPAWLLKKAPTIPAVSPEEVARFKQRGTDLYARQQKAFEAGEDPEKILGSRHGIGLKPEGEGAIPSAPQEAHRHRYTAREQKEFGPYHDTYAPYDPPDPKDVADFSRFETFDPQKKQTLLRERAAAAKKRLALTTPPTP